MPRLSSLFAATGNLTLTVGEQVIHAVYRPGVYTQAYEGRYIEASAKSASPTDVDAMNQVLCDLLVSWDLTDDSDELIPLTPEGLAAALPFGAVFAIFTALLRALRVTDPTSAQPS